MSKNKKISFKTILSIVTLILVGIVIYKNRTAFFEAAAHIQETNIFVLLLLIPEQLIMYYACGQIFFSFLAAKKNAKKVSPFTLMRVSLELNFVNHAVPAGGFGGLAYVAWRLKKFGATPGQSSFMYGLRYAITVIANQIQTLIAIAILLIFGSIPDGSSWIILLTVFVSFAVIVGIGIIVVIASSAKRVHWFSRLVSNMLNGLVKAFTFGKKRNKLTYNIIDKYLMDINGDLTAAIKNKQMLTRPIMWGIIYSFLEVAIYWIVAISRGNPWVMPQIMIGEAIGSVLGTIFPIGPYEAGMIWAMSLLGVTDAIAIVCIARVAVLGTTIISGYGFYQNAISKMDKNEVNKK